MSMVNQSKLHIYEDPPLQYPKSHIIQCKCEQAHLIPAYIAKVSSEGSDGTAPIRSRAIEPSLLART